jgi:uncharacterized protein with HEPN domain
MRNAIVHDYFDIGWQRVLDTVKNDLPPLLQQIERAAQDAKLSRAVEPTKHYSSPGRA